VAIRRWHATPDPTPDPTPDSTPDPPPDSTPDPAPDPTHNPPAAACARTARIPGPEPPLPADGVCCTMPDRCPPGRRASVSGRPKGRRAPRRTTGPDPRPQVGVIHPKGAIRPIVASPISTTSRRQIIALLLGALSVLTLASVATYQPPLPFARPWTAAHP